MTALEELLQKDCDFESWQFINAKLVLDWLWNNVPDEDLQKWHMGNIHERLNFYLFECAMSKSRQKRLKDYSISELEQEIKKRKKHGGISMKELSIEEKAKRYDKAVKMAKSKIKNDKDHVLYEDDIIEIFPELNESDDERTRKALIDFVKSRLAGFPQCEKYIAWIEKQGQNNSQVALPPFTFDDILALQCCMETVKKVQEDKDLYEKLKDLHGRVYDAYQLETQNDNADKVEQKDYNSIDPHFGKFINKVEPKFKVGDWVVENKPNNYARFIQILGIVDVQGKDRYGISRDIHNDEDIVDFDFVEKYYHIFDIQDAKDGDVLCTYECDEPKVVFILKGTPKRQRPCVLSYHCYYNLMYPYFESDFEKGCLAPNKEDVKPATKEQCDILFRKMKEAGYEWDANKKELKEL